MKDKVTILQGVISDLEEQNAILNEKNKNLQAQIIILQEIIEKASHYREEHQTTMFTLNEARQKYENALRETLIIKKELETQYTSLIESLQP